ncbi:MAG: extracellular solute-binding protein [Defluviitaleaceae bacterium]|nr:extracellular solute-binding protein [Defluviitaleaceae bacterium]MCL2238928.1 extracellular solute-binding protein [Defluviitaleaceae bacterium]
MKKVITYLALLLILALSTGINTHAQSINSGEELDFSITPPAAGIYEIWVYYRTAPRQMRATEVTLSINGEVTMPALRRLSFEGLWLRNAPSVDRYDNQVPTMPTASGEVLSKPLEDSTHMISRPLTFAFTANTYVLTFHSNDGYLRIYDVVLRPPRVIPPYTPGDASGSHIVVIGGQEFFSANNPSIRAAGEYNPVLYPYTASRRLLNLLDGGSFSRPGDRVNWVVDIPEDGWYYIGIMYRQTAKTNFPVFIDILINGEVPTTAAQAVQLPHSNAFRTLTVPAPDGDNNQTFWFTQGTHTVSFVIRIEPIGEVYNLVNTMLREITDFRTEITRLTGGASIDRHRHFRLDDFLPDVEGTLLSWADMSRQALDFSLEYTTGRASSVFAGLGVAESTLLSLAERHHDLPRRLDELSGAPYSVTRFLAQVLQDMDNNAVSIDRVLIFQAEAELPTRPGWFTRFIEAVRRFFVSFTRREFEAGQATEEDVLQVWMVRPRPFVELAQQMVDAEFTPRTGIRVDISIMPDVGRFALAAAAGNAPDVGLSVHYVMPSYLNIRGALADLRQFDNFRDVATRFPEGLFVPGIVEGGVYALPETINFWVMFYRRDIFEQLGIPVPDNMDEVLMILPELQRRSMNFFFPTAGMPAMRVFPGTMPLILQNGGGFFGDTIGPSMLKSEASLEGFTLLTDLFTVFNMPVEVPFPGFYQEFRTGTLPIGVADVGTYNLLMNAAPELDGLWNIATFPGLVQPDGSVSRYTTGGDTSSIIFSCSNMQDEAWKFLDWWSSDEVQSDFGTTLVALYGTTFLWNSANRVAFSQLPIPGAHREIILRQTEYMVEVPWVPGTYMVERELSNAFNSVVINGMNPRRAMDIAVIRIDREVGRKLEEFGFTRGGEWVRDFVTPCASILWED